MHERIDRDTLRSWLEEGRPVTVLDVGPASAFEAWHVPGSRHVPAYEALGRGEEGPLDEVTPDPNAPVVTVCPRGRTSARAAEFLRTRGYDARSLEGGHRAWSLAWNVAEADLADAGGARVLQVRRTGKGCLSYLVGDGTEAAVVDPALPPEVYLDLARARGWTVTRVLETHVQADHLSRARALAGAAGAPLLMPAGAPVEGAFEPLDDGDVVRIGSVALQALRSPGHTPESTTFRLGDGALLTGDTLFLQGVGRPDLDAAPEEAAERAVTLHGSLRRLLALPGSLQVLPGHTDAPVPFDGRPLQASLAEVRRRIPLMEAGVDRFTRAVLEALPPPPENAGTVKDWNRAGALPDDPSELEAGANRCAAPVGSSS